MEANTDAGSNLINLPADTFKITIPPHDATGTNGRFLILTDLTIIGAGSGGTIIDAQGLDRIFDIAVGVTMHLSGLTLRNGLAGAIRSGAGAEAGASLSLDDVIVEDNTAGDGGGVTANGTLMVTNSIFRRNHAPSGEGGGIFYVGTLAGQSLTLKDVQLLDNASGTYGGVSVHGVATLDNVTTTGNTSGAGGGIGAFGDVTIKNSVISDNTAPQVGQFLGFAADIYTANSKVTISNSKITGNQAAGQGGGLMVLEQFDGAANITIDNSTIDGNSASEGGGIRMGGGASAGGGLVTITNSTISNNTAQLSGVAVSSFGKNRISHLVATNVTISGNVSHGNGGGIASAFDSAYFEGQNVTIADNQAQTGGGFYTINGSHFAIGDSLIADNTPEDCFGHIILQQANLIKNVSNCDPAGPSVGALISSDPALGPLTDNGGGTQTQALPVGSPAVDAGTTCPPPATDQRGITRPQGAACDLGAFELVLGLIWGDTNCNDFVQANDGLPLLFSAAGLQNASVNSANCPALGSPLGPAKWGDSDCSGTIDSQDMITILKYEAGLPEGPIPAGCPHIGDVILLR